MNDGPRHAVMQGFARKGYLAALPSAEIGFCPVPSRYADAGVVYWP